MPPKWCDTPPWYLVLAQAHLCDTPSCNVSRDNCAIPHKKQARKGFAILSLQVSRDMKSIAAGPLIRKIRAPIKIKSALPPPPKKPPQKRGILWTRVFPAERAHIFQVSIKLAHPFPAPELRTRILRTREDFSDLSFRSPDSWITLRLQWWYHRARFCSGGTSAERRWHKIFERRQF